MDFFIFSFFQWYAGLKWQQTYCPDVEWVAKADDDTVVDLRRLDFWIDHKFRQVHNALKKLFFLKNKIIFDSFLFILPSLFSHRIL